VYSDTQDCKPLYAEDGAARIELITNLQKAYSGTIIQNTDKIKTIVSVDLENPQALEKLSSTLISNNLWWKVTSNTPTITTQDGECWTANKIYSYTDTSYAADTLCTNWTPNPTTPNFPTEWTPVNWTCEWTGQPIWTTENCTAEITATPINWECWISENTPTLTIPTTNLCTKWTQTSVTSNTVNFTWSCEWINDWSITESCSAPRQYTVTFNWNTNTSWSMSNKLISANTSANLTTNTFVKTWYTFAWWATTSWWSVAYANWASYTMWTSNVTLYAKWTANNNTITFIWNWSTSWSMTNQTLATNATANLTTNAFVKSWYTFVWWATTSWWSVAYANGASYTMWTNSVTLYAKWLTNWFAWCSAPAEIRTATTKYSWCNTYDIIVCNWIWTWYAISACDLWSNTSLVAGSTYLFWSLPTCATWYHIPTNLQWQSIQSAWWWVWSQKYPRENPLMFNINWWNPRWYYWSSNAYVRIGIYFRPDIPLPYNDSDFTSNINSTSTAKHGARCMKD